MGFGLGLGLGFSRNHQPSKKERRMKYLFVDGGCLRAALKSMSKNIIGDENALKIRFEPFASGHQKTFWYDAVPARDHQETQSDYDLRVEASYEEFNLIKSLDRFHVSLGEIKGHGRNRRQKQVDVRLTVDMLMHTFRGNMHEATLLAGDDDFIPLLEALVREGMMVRIWHPPQASEALLSAADSRQAFDFLGCSQFLSRDGMSQAFIPNWISGAGPPHEQDFFWQWSEGPTKIGASWRDDRFRVVRWRDEKWTGQEIEARGCTLKQAKAAHLASFNGTISDIVPDY